MPGSLEALMCRARLGRHHFDVEGFLRDREAVPPARAESLGPA